MTYSCIAALKTALVPRKQSSNLGQKVVHLELAAYNIMLYCGMGNIFTMLVRKEVAKCKLQIATFCALHSSFAMGARSSCCVGEDDPAEVTLGLS